MTFQLLYHYRRNLLQNIQNKFIMMRISRRASDIKLKLVGKRNLLKATRSISITDIQMAQPNLTDKKSKFSTEWVDDQSMKKSKQAQKYSAIEDTRVSRFTHQKILIVEKNILLLSLLVIFFGMLKLEIDEKYSSGEMAQKIMRIMSCVTLILILLVILRKVLMLQLQMDQRKVYIRRDNRKQCKSSLLLLLSHKKQSFLLLVEILAILAHPNTLFQGATYSYFTQNYKLGLKYSYNDLLSVLMLLKVFLVFRSFISLTIYSSPRIIRLCRHKNFEYSFFYSIKCIQHEHPIFFIILVFFITLFVFAFGFRVTEGRVKFLNKNIPQIKDKNLYFHQYFNCLWYTFITMTSLGYGDFTPKTILARFLASILTIFGLTLNSFLVVAFSQYLKMKSQQIRSHTTLERLIQHKKLQQQAADTFSEIIKVSRYMSNKNLDPLMTRKLKPMFNDLKSKIDSTKAESHRIRAILPEQNKTELMIHEFQVLLDGFRTIHKKQTKMKSRLMKIQQKRDVDSRARQSFLKEVTVLINQRK